MTNDWIAWQGAELMAGDHGDAARDSGGTAADGETPPIRRASAMGRDVYVSAEEAGAPH
jgi:hypothetical protein